MQKIKESSALDSISEDAISKLESSFFLLTNETTDIIPVKAFMKVERDRLSILKNGSLTGNLCEPHRAVCSRI